MSRLTNSPPIAALTRPEPAGPGRVSWWLGLTRVQFQAELQDRQGPRMRTAADAKVAFQTTRYHNTIGKDGRRLERPVRRAQRRKPTNTDTGTEYMV